MSTTRRELLSLLFGATCAARCRQPNRSIEWNGGFVDDGASDGHRLRDGFRPTIPSDLVPERSTVLILGAGISGLSAGWRLRKRGLDDFRILELATEPGGTSVGGASDVSRYPWGAHYVPTPGVENPELRALFEETQSLVPNRRGELVFDEAQLCAAPEERLFLRGEWRRGLFPEEASTSLELEEWRRFRAKVDGFVARRDGNGARPFRLPIDRTSDEPAFEALDCVSMEAWCDEHGFTSPLVRWNLAYACRDDYGSELKTTSAWYGLHYFCARMEAVGDDGTELLTWPEGNQFLVDHFVRAIGPERFALGTVVLEISPVEGNWMRVVAWDRARSRARVFFARRVIFALPSFLRSRILANIPNGTGHSADYSPWLVANLHLAERPRSTGFETAWDNVVFRGRSLGYVVATHQRGRPYGPTVWTYYLPFTGEDARAERRLLESLSYEDASRAIVDELSGVHEDFARSVRRIDIRRWGHAMVRPGVGTRFSADRLRASRPVSSIHFAHTDLSGVALFEEAFHHGLRAADEVVDAISR